MRVTPRAVVLSICLLAAGRGWAIAGPSAPATPPPPPWKLTGWTQVDGVLHDDASVDALEPSTRTPRNTERVLVRRARIRFEGARGPWTATLELDGNTIDGAKARLLAADVGGHWRRGDLDLRVAAGLMKVPFGVEVPARERDRVFIEPFLAARALFPGNYDAGLAIHGRWRVATWSVAAMNGAPVGDAQYHGVDPRAAYDLLGRVGVASDGCGWRLSAGVSALAGHALSPGGKAIAAQLVWTDDNQDGMVQLSELRQAPGTPAVPGEPFARRGLGLDAGVRYWIPRVGWGEAQAELIAGRNLDRGLLVANPITADRELRELGLSVSAVQDVAIRRLTTLVGVRVDRYAGDRSGDDPTWTSVAIVVGIRSRDTRALLGLDHERVPTEVAASSSSNDRVTLRAQVGF